MPTTWPKLLLALVLLATGRIGLSADNKHDLPRLERSFWLHASLARTAQKGYWGPACPASSSPAEPDIRNAAKLLTGTYAANRLYLVYHAEIPVDQAEQVFRWWRQHSPETVTLVRLVGGDAVTVIGPAVLQYPHAATRRIQQSHGDGKATLPRR